MKTKRLRGFTLFELAIVITIIAILSAIGYISYTGSKTKANYTQTRTDMQQIVSAATMFRVDHKQYPADGAGAISSDFKNYLPSNPIPPCSGYTYGWENLSTPQYAGVSYREPAPHSDSILFYYEIKKDPAYTHNAGSQDIQTLGSERITCTEKVSS